MLHIILGALLSINDAVQASMRAQNVPGAQVEISDGVKQPIGRGYGVMNTNTRARVTVDTRFEIGSITKQMTAAAILQLKEQGKVKLTDPLGTYIPEYAPGRNVTIEQLMWHVSGVPDYMFVKGFPYFWNLSKHSAGGFKDILSLINDAPLQFASGTQYAYSNSNYALLAEVIERVSHMTWQDYLRKNIFERAGMIHTTFMEDEPTVPEMATGYRKNNGSLSPGRCMCGWAFGAGSVVSTSSDVAKWDQAFFAGKIISIDDVALSTTPHVLPSGNSASEGFAWKIDTFDGQTRYTYTGRTFDFTAENEYFPKLHQAVVVLTNTSDEQVDFIAGAAFEASHPAIAAEARAPAYGEDPRVTALVRQWIARLEASNIDVSKLDGEFAREGVPEAEKALKPFGAPTAITYKHARVDGDGSHYLYLVDFKGASFIVAMSVEPNGKISDISLLAR
jgi:CubicO group peptidase (beta-lactamase class C family)